MARDAAELLADLKRRKRNRQSKEVQAALQAHGWTCRKAGKEQGVWQSPTGLTFTFPNDHNRPVKTRLVSIACDLLEKDRHNLEAKEVEGE